MLRNNSSTNRLVKLAIHILTIVANSVGAEHFFSILGIIHTKLRNLLDSTSIHNAATLTMEIRREHIRLGLTADRRRRKYGKDGPEPDSLTPDATAMLNDIDASTWWIPMTIQLAVLMT